MPPEITPTLLIVEDDRAVRTLLERTLSAPGRAVITAENGVQALKMLEENKPRVVILDLGLPDLEGVDIITAAIAGYRHTMIIVLTGRADQPSVMESMRRGAMEYLVKPFDPDALIELVEKAFRKAQQDGAAGSGPVVTGTAMPDDLLVGKSPAIIGVFKTTGMLASSPIPVLITGESGTGKELVARSLHRYGPNPAGPFIVVDCASIPGTLMESELFGHERGAFTGADTARAGRFEQADGGTIFLDEAGNIPPEIQPKLLRALQEKTIQRLGSTKTITWNARVISASNSRLWEMAREGKYREDLLFRLAGAEISLPPLRERPGDLPLLVDHFLSRHAGDRGKLAVSPEAMKMLESYGWPGNIRELRHALERAVALSRGGVIDAEHLPDKIRGAREAAPATPAMPAGKNEITSMDEMKRRYARQVLESCGGNKSEAARLLGIDRSTLYELLSGD